MRSPQYASAVEESLPKVVTRAAFVLEGVKERGRKAGDIMSKATEEALKPQVGIERLSTCFVFFFSYSTRRAVMWGTDKVSFGVVGEQSR